MSNNIKNSLEEILSSQNTNLRQLDIENAQLQQEVEKLKRAKTEERFLWVLVFITLFDAHCFSNANSWGGPVVIGIIELILVIVIAESLEIRSIVGVVEKIFNIFKHKE